MHPIHVSVCNLELNETKSTVSFKLFKDDFAQVLKNLYNEDVILENADEKKNSEIINRYINSCFQVNVNKNIRLALEYKNSEINEEAVWLHYTVQNTKSPSNISIKNTLMLDLWEDQTNLVILKFKDKENGYRFDEHETIAEIDLRE